MSIKIDLDILNQKGTPAFYTDTLANRPLFGFKGRVFLSTDTGQIFEDTGSAWTLLADAGVGGGSLETVTTNGNTTDKGIIITANGLSSNSVTIPTLSTGSMLFAGTTSQIQQDNTNIYWDDTNNRLGIQTNSPGTPLDIHSTQNNILSLNNVSTGSSYILFQQNNTTLFKIGYTNGTGTFDITNVGTLTNPVSINATTNAITFSNNITASSLIKSGGTSSQYLMADGSVSTLTNPVTGTGTTNQLTQFTGSSTIGNSTIIQTTSYGITVNSAGNILFAQGSSVNPTAGYNLISGDTNGIFFWLGSSLNRAYFNISGLTAARNYFLPDATGTIALTSSISGTTNYVPKFTGTNAIGNSLIYDTGTNVGIGTTSPSYLLDIQSTSATLRIKNTTAPATGGISSLLFEGINNYSGTSQSFINSIQAGNSGSTQLVFGTSGTTDATATERMRITSGGNLLVNTSTDSGQKLQVNGTSYFSSYVGIGAAGISSYSLFVSGNTYLKGATSGSSDYALVIQNSSATNLFLVRNDGAATFSGSIAIGNTVTASVNNLVTNKVAIVINGTQYYLLASTSSI